MKRSTHMSKQPPHLLKNSLMSDSFIADDPSDGGDRDDSVVEHQDLLTNLLAEVR